MLFAAAPALAQSALDQTDSAIIQRDLPQTGKAPRARSVPIETEHSTQIRTEIAETEGVFIGAIQVDGSKALPVSEYSSALEPYIGRRLSNQDLASAAQAVANVARGKGYAFASAIVPQQSLSLGVLHIRLDEGLISDIRIQGVDNKQVRRILRQLIGHPVALAEAEKQILLAGDVPGISINKVRFVRERDRGLLVVDVAQDRQRGYVAFDNLGTQAVGPVRAILALDMSSLLTDGDNVTLQTVSTITQPKELGFVALSYSVPLNANGTTLTISTAYGRTQAGGFLAPFEAKGRSLNVSASINQPLLRSREANLWLSGGIDYLKSTQSLLGQLAREDRLTTASLTLGGNVALLGGRLQSELTLTKGLGWLRATRIADPLASRQDGDGVFTKLNLWADWTGPIKGPISMRVAGTAQFADRALLAPQEIGVGGSRFGRAFGNFERSGDQGVAGLVELRTDLSQPTKWLNWAQLYTFVDGGKVTNFENGFGGGTLYSGGGGFRARVNKFDLGLEAAMPLNAARFDSGNRSPRFNMQLSTSF